MPEAPTRPFKIYRSSAGSGKTYTLAREYLRLALRYPDYYRHILAVTFTNKATREMKERIVASLYSFASGEPGTMGRELCEELGWDGERFRQRSREVLSHVLHGYGHFSISTIDAFFQKVIRSFAKEVGLHGGFRLELDQEKVLTETIDELMLEVGENAALTAWLVEFAQEKFDEGKSWDVRRDIMELSGELFKEYFTEVEAELLLLVGKPGFFEQFQKQVCTVSSAIESWLRDTGCRAVGIMEQQGLVLEDFSRKGQGPMGYLCRFAQGRFLDSKGQLFPPNSYVSKGLEGVEGWVTKTSKKKEAVTQAVEGGLMGLLEALVHYYHENKERYETSRQVSHYLYTFGILMDVARKLRAYKADHNIMLISDAARFLKEIIAENDTPFVYEKVGSFYHHYLIDEFQDTSAFQWANFRPLIMDSLAQGRTDLVVGDIKQSIYRWRGGDWRLLLDGVSGDIGMSQTEVLPLGTNYRSDEYIIGFNNRFFQKAAPYLVRDLLSRQPDEEGSALRHRFRQYADRIAQAYQDVAQDCPGPKAGGMTGRVGIGFFEEKVDGEVLGEEVSWREKALKAIPALLEQWQDEGIDLMEVAILVRKAREGKAIADYMMEFKRSGEGKKGYRYEVISNEALFLESAPTVRLLLNLFRHLVHPYDSIAKANIIYDYQKYVLGREEVDLHALFASVHTMDMGMYLPEDFVRMRDWLRRIPLYELVEELIRMFCLNTFPGDFAYLQAFQDVILSFETTEHGGIVAFLDWWSLHGRRQAVQASEETAAVRIMTVHKSKGLQFKAVLIPFCDWALDHEPSQANILWCQSGEKPYDEVGHLPLRYTQRLAGTSFKEDYYEEMAQSYMDNLNLLYVAFTRAESLLQAFAPEPRAGQRAKVSDVVYAIVSSPGFMEGGLWHEGERRFELGRAVGTVKPQVGEVDEPSVRLSVYPSHTWRKKLSIKRSGKGFFRGEKMGAHTRARVDEGRLLHSLLSRVRYKRELPEALNALYFEGLVTEGQRAALEQQLEELLRHPVVGSWFGEAWEVKTEVPILPKTGEVRRLDRVMLQGDKAVIIDYKTGEKKARDQAQLREYIALLEAMGHKEVEAYLLYIHDMDVVQVYK